MLSGKLEKLLDRRFGPIQSMAIRINVGLAGSLAICASFPFTTRTHSSLLWTVMLLGTVSSVAFSTSYQVGYKELLVSRRSYVPHALKGVPGAGGMGTLGAAIT